MVCVVPGFEMFWGVECFSKRREPEELERVDHPRQTQNKNTPLNKWLHYAVL